MVVLLTVLGIVSLAELCLWIIPSLLIKRLAGVIVAAALITVSTALLLTNTNAATITTSIVSIYRMVNLLRLITARIHEKHLDRVCAQSGIWLVCTQLAICITWFLLERSGTPPEQLWYVVTGLIATITAVLVASTIRHLRTTKAPKLPETGLAIGSLPTLTVAIPARNETEDLEECLRTLIASDYPKLEILVLDDCSQNRQTPEIIRSYAHDGVRFLQGITSGDKWLAKNMAYQQLFEESNGELILFCGVDVRFQPQSLRTLVMTLNFKKKSMISLIPRNVIHGTNYWHQSILLQPMRYAWELALPRRLFKRPPVLSTCWIIKREVMETAGGFGAVSRSIVPESYLARVSAVHDGYSFMRSDDAIGIISVKRLHDQLRTVIRTRYPQAHRRIELVFFLTMIEISSIFFPPYIIQQVLTGRLPVIFALVSGMIISLLVAVYTTMVYLTYHRFLVRFVFGMPFAVLADVLLINYSMLAYEFFVVTWKGRNICIPVMRINGQLL